jgi:hypothetical protein
VLPIPRDTCIDKVPLDLCSVYCFSGMCTLNVLACLLSFFVLPLLTNTTLG